MARKINRLTARTVATLTEHGRHADGGGLYLAISPNGGRRWTFMFNWHSKQTEIGFGSARDVPLGRARELATQARALLAEGRNPKETKATSTSVTFGDCADDVIKAMQPSWRGQHTTQSWKRSLHRHAAPLRHLPVDKITTDDVLAVLKPLWSTMPPSSLALRQRIEHVLDAAKARGLRSGENPARWRGHLDQLLPRLKKFADHHAAMPFENVSAFVRHLRTQETTTVRALEFAILTACRPGEVRGARWNEVDLDRAVWTIPANRMKAGREHRVPLSARALEIAATMHAIRLNDFVFPGQKPGRPISATAIKNELKTTANVTVHGFRSSFRDWASECTHFSNETCEAALAHAVANQTEAAYRRGDLFDKRRALMNAWADYCAATEDRKVIALSR